MKKKTTPKLSSFRWKGHNSVGKKVSGQLLAIRESEVRAKLNAQHIKVRKISKNRISLFTRLFHRTQNKDITILTRQISTMLAAGVPIIQALKLVSDNHKKAEMKSILTQISTAVEAGTPLSTAMRNSSSRFDPLYVDLIQTGEQSGNLSQVFERLATYREKSEQLRAKVIKALIYPAMVVLVALTVSYLMLTVVIPEFETMFHGFGAELPWFTQQVLKLSSWVQSYSLAILITFITASLLFKTVRKKSWLIKLKTSRIGLKTPIIGAIIMKASVAKFSRTLATSFSAGIPILSSLTATAKTAGNAYFENALNNVHRDTASGMPMYVAMRNTEAFPEMVLQMVMIGEESGKLEEMLNKIATIYEFEVDNTVDNLGKILEPLIIVLLGVIIGGLVIAMYLPIFNLMSVLG